MSTTCYIALGSNLGDRLAHLRHAVAALHEAGAPATAISGVFETTPVDCPPDASAFYNAALECHTDLQPAALLDMLLQIEHQAGRTRTQRNAPRTLDLDLLFFDELVTDAPALTLPHPRLHERLFVLAPLRQLAPRFIHPRLRQTIVQLYDTCIATSREMVRLVAPSLMLNPTYPH